MARRDHLQFPWESEGWATEEFRATRDADLDAVVQEALNGAPSLYGVRQNRAFVNPYISGALFVVPAAIGWVVWWLSDREWWGSLVFFILSAVAVVVAVQTARMIPGWHRARAAARAYTAARGIPLPRELRWYG